MSVNDLLGALAAAQKEREGCIEHLRKEGESQRKRAENAEQKLTDTQDELRQYKERELALAKKTTTLEELMESQREVLEKSLNQKEEDYKSNINNLKDEIESLNKKFKYSQRQNNELTEELAQIKHKMKKMANDEENLIEESKKQKVEFNSILEECEKAKKSHEIAQSELHLVKMQLLKENNINDRLLDEVKRSRKDIEGYRSEIRQLKIHNEEYSTQMGKQIKQLSGTMQAALNKLNIYEDLHEVKSNLSSVLKENFVINTKMNEVYKFLIHGNVDIADTGTQTIIGAEDMFSYETMEREISILVLRLREELVINKNEIINLKEQNDLLKNVIKEMKRERVEYEEIIENEAENRVLKLEKSVREIKETLNEDSRKKEGINDRRLAENLEIMKKEVESLKSKLNRQTQKAIAERDLKITPTVMSAKASKRLGKF